MAHAGFRAEQLEDDVPTVGRPVAREADAGDIQQQAFLVGRLCPAHVELGRTAAGRAVGDARARRIPHGEERVRLIGGETAAQAPRQVVHPDVARSLLDVGDVRRHLRAVGGEAQAGETRRIADLLEQAAQPVQPDQLDGGRRRHVHQGSAVGGSRELCRGSRLQERHRPAERHRLTADPACAGVERNGHQRPAPHEDEAPAGDIGHLGVRRHQRHGRRLVERAHVEERLLLARVPAGQEEEVTAVWQELRPHFDLSGARLHARGRTAGSRGAPEARPRARELREEDRAFVVPGAGHRELRFAQRFGRPALGRNLAELAFGEERQGPPVGRPERRPAPSVPASGCADNASSRRSQSWVRRPAEFATNATCRPSGERAMAVPTGAASRLVPTGSVAANRTGSSTGPVGHRRIERTLAARISAHAIAHGAHERRASGSAPARSAAGSGTTSTAWMKRYPRPGSVSTKRGAWAESPSASRSRFTAAFSPCSKSTNVSSRHRRARSSSRVTTCPGRSSSAVSSSTGWRERRTLASPRRSSPAARSASNSPKRTIFRVERARPCTVADGRRSAKRQTPKVLAAVRFS